VSASSEAAPAGARRGGILLRVEGELRFIAAADALRISPPPRITPVPGAPASLLGVTLHEGAVVPVLAVGSARTDMIVCQHAGEVLGLVGAELLRTGTFDGAIDGIVVDGQRVAALDLAVLYARAHASPRSRLAPPRG
jgi:chemotaxis signal transduction protein